MARGDDTDRRGNAIDLHAHAYSLAAEELMKNAPGYADEQTRAIREMGASSAAWNSDLMRGLWRDALLRPDVRLQTMDDASIAQQVVSVSPMQYYYWADLGLAGEAVAALNESIVQLRSQTSGRVLGMGAVALQHPELAASQVAAAVQDYGFYGVIVSTHAPDCELDDPALEDFWTSAEAVGAVVFIHPAGCSCDGRLADYYLSNIIGNPLETTMALTRLIVGGVLDRHENLKICAAHGGGYLPYYVGRLDRGFEVRPEGHGCKRPPSTYLSGMWFDSVVHDARTLNSLLNRVGYQRVVLGSDFPFDMGIERPVAVVDQVVELSGEQRQAVLRGNALALLGLREAGEAADPERQRQKA